MSGGPHWYTPVPKAVGTRRTTWHWVRGKGQDDGPALPLYLSEPARAVADYGLYLAARPLMPRLPHGDGHSVLVLPGLLADDVSTRALRTVLRKLGYDVHGWGLGRNIGPDRRVREGHPRPARPPQRQLGQAGHA